MIGARGVMNAKKYFRHLGNVKNMNLEKNKKYKKKYMFCLIRTKKILRKKK